MSDEPIRVCFVCLGNICRSPTAEAAFLHRIERDGVADRFVVDSAGTSAYHVGERAHPDTRREAKRRGVDVASRSRQFVREDFDRFDYVIAMDHSNETALRRLAPDEGAQQKISLFRKFDDASPDDAEVPDPYYAGGFDKVFDICDAAAAGFLSYVRSEQGI